MKRIPHFTIIIDTREQAPLAIPAHWQKRGTLHTADYSIEGLEDEFAIERKSLADLVQSLTHERARFEREMKRLSAFRFKRVLVEAPYKMLLQDAFEFSLAKPYAIRASVAAFEVRYDIPFVFADGRREAVGMIMRWARYYTRERARENYNDSETRANHEKI